MAGGYPDLVAPIVPDAQKNKAPEIMLQGFRTGFAAAAEMANRRRQAERDLAEMAQREKIAEEEHEIQRERIQKDYELTGPLNAAHINALNTAADLNTARRTEILSGYGTAAQRAAMKQARMDALNGAFNKRMASYGLDDPQVAGTEPVKFGANLVKLRDEFGLAGPVSPYIRGALTQLQRLADQQKIHMRPVTRDETGLPKATGEGKDVPIWQVAERLQDPGTRAATLDALRANGHLTDQPATRTLKPGLFNKAMDIFGHGSYDETAGQKDTTNLPALEEAMHGNVPFEHKRSVVPQDILNMAPAYSPPTATPAPETGGGGDENGEPLSQAYPPTDLDRLIAQATGAIQSGADPRAIAERWQGMGLDPSLLFGPGTGDTGPSIFGTELVQPQPGEPQPGAPLVEEPVESEAAAAA